MKCCKNCLRYDGISQYDTYSLYNDDIGSYYLIECSCHQLDGNSFSYDEGAEDFAKKHSCPYYEQKK